MPAVDADRLAARTLELVNIASPSGEEAELMRYLAATLPLEPAYADDDIRLVLPRGRGGGRPFVLFAGHVDTVPAQGNFPGRIEGGAVHGLGASDMKGAVAVMLELALWAVAAELAFDPGFVFFTREEVALDESPLPRLFETGLVDGADLVVVMEPTDNALQAGCVGSVNALARFRGEAAHSARPWQGVNAILVAAERLLSLGPPLEVEIDGLTFRETLTPTLISGGVAKNVVPDLVEVTLNFRYAPHRSRGDALRRLGDLIGPGVEWEPLDHAPAAHVNLSNPLLPPLRAAGGFEVQPKQAWTPVAQFAERGLDAINLGPGATRYAHKREERVETAELVRCFEALQRFLSGS
jgi:succinyl-diaminopimelate desuccinylase